MDHGDRAPFSLATPLMVLDPLWYPDSQASHRITNDNNNFSTKTTYNDNDSMKLGNGSNMKIKHISTT